jgi:cytochrome c biogenesis protein CcmG/thiol:disulfide interchange protein DsbE
MMKNIFILLLFVTALMHAAESEAPDAKDFTLEDIDGNPVNLDSLLAKGPVFMSYWALWCKMCIKELDALIPYYEELDSLGVTVLAVSQDKAKSVPKVKPFVQSHRWKYIVVMDHDNFMRNLYDVQAMPSSFIISQDKKIVSVHQGFKPGDEKIIVEELRALTEVSEESE